jgi:anti-sigma factor RsiW
MKIDPCKDESLLSALIDDEVYQKVGTAVRRHMEDCHKCKQRFEELQKTDEMIRDMATMEPSADFDRTFWSKVNELENRNKERSRLISILTGRRPLIAAGAIAALMAIFFIYTGHNGRLTSEEMFIAQNMEMLQDYDLIERLDMLEQWDNIEAVKEPS